MTADPSRNAAPQRRHPLDDGAGRALPSLPFTKASGAGNDFVIVPAEGAPPSERTIRAWCSRALSLGADGVIRLGREEVATSPSSDDMASAEQADVRMVHWNADGGRSELCLNGSRCAARLAFELGWARSDTLRLRTDSGVLVCRRSADQRIELRLPDALGGAPRVVELSVELSDPQPTAPGSALSTSHRFRAWHSALGVPHLVVPWGDLASLPIETLGPALRFHAELGPAGANVNFVRTVSPRHLEIRTYERGVEGETLACGTGAVASALAGFAAGELQWPVRVGTAGGFVLEVDRRPDPAAGGEPASFLAGDARIIAWGRLGREAEELPEPPAWSPAAAGSD